ncbi:MAG TPA: 5'/3'-nucleotidase SurE [Bacillota bacterium]|jgi:5'-nucleotidase
MIVLLTNDDGIRADGIQALKVAFEAVPGSEVYVVAPDRERSASGHAITIHHPLQVEEVQLEGKTPGRAFAVSGTPADCVKLGVKAILPEAPGIIVSGINRGPNLGTDVFYSGTVSAALEGVILGIPSIAVSMTAFEYLDYTVAANFAVHVAGEVVRRGLPERTLLNINVPPLSPEEIAGVALTRLGERPYENIFERRFDPRGKLYYWLVVEDLALAGGADTDVGAIRDNLISVTPIHLDLTNHDVMETLSRWSLGLNGDPCRWKGEGG